MRTLILFLEVEQPLRGYLTDVLTTEWSVPGSTALGGSLGYGPSTPPGLPQAVMEGLLDGARYSVAVRATSHAGLTSAAAARLLVDRTPPVRGQLSLLEAAHTPGASARFAFRTACHEHES